MAKKQKLVQFTTPIGTARWPRLNSPDTRYNAKGVYKVDIALDPEDIPAVRELIDSQLELAKAMAEEEFPGKILEPDSPPLFVDEDTGETRLKARTTASFESNGEIITRKMPLFDAAMRPMSDIVGSGSRIRASVSMKPYARGSTERKTVALYGLAMYLNGVQVAQLVAPGADPTAMGFEALEPADDQDLTEEQRESEEIGGDYAEGADY